MRVCEIQSGYSFVRVTVLKLPVFAVTNDPPCAVKPVSPMLLRDLLIISKTSTYLSFTLVPFFKRVLPINAELSLKHV